MCTGFLLSIYRHFFFSVILWLSEAKQNFVAQWTPNLMIDLLDYVSMWKRLVGWIRETHRTLFNNMVYLKGLPLSNGILRTDYTAKLYMEDR